MPRSGGNTWQARGEYLAGCLGLTAPLFAAGVDKAMAAARQGTAAGAATNSAGAARKKTQRKGAAAKQTADAGT
jgi:hypothetical protein